MRVSRSIVGVTEADAVKRLIIEDGYLGMGAEVQKFEEELAAFFGLPPNHVACVNSGTAALHLALEAALEPGDEVLVQSLTFVATYQAIAAAGAVPVSCEVRPETVTIDLADAKRRLTKKTRAILPVHYASNPGNLGAIYDFAAAYKLRVIEDAAHAFGCEYGGKRVGSFGDIACFSFDGIKNITSGEGGAVVSGDPSVMSRVRDARLLGVEHDTEKRFSGQRSWQFDVKRRGYRFHMSNIHAAIGRVQLQRFEKEFRPKRIQLARHYRERLACLSGLRLLEADLDSIVPHIQPVRVLADRRDALRAYLRQQGVETGLHYLPNHRLSLFGGGRSSLPLTEQLYAELLSLPLHPGLEISDVNQVCNWINDFFAQNKP